MYQMAKTRRYVITAMCITLCCVVPMVLHFIPWAGSTVMPMHVPVLLAGLILGWYFGLLTGLFGPLLSSFTTGMPLMAYVPHMMVELAVYGAVAGFLIRFMRTKNLYANIYASLIPAMILGRIAGGVVRMIFFAPALADTTIIAWWLSSYFITSIPGIVIQLILIPAVIVALEKSKLVRK